MPNAYLQKLSKTTGKSMDDLESKWSQAKAISAKAGHTDDFAYITGVFKKMAGVNESLNEGFIKTAMDWATAIRIVRMLILPWHKQGVYRLGLVDVNGNKLKNAETDEEKSEMTPLVILVLKLKRLFDKLPAGSQIASIGAAYSMLREQCITEQIDVDVLDEMFTAYAKDTGLELLEDVPVNVSGGISAPGDVVVPKVRNKWKDLDKVAGSHTFDVDKDMFDKVRQPKEKGASWSTHLGDDETSQKIKQFAKTYPKKPIMIRRADTNTHQWLRK